MGETKQINIKNRTCYFYNDIIDLKNFNAKLLKIDKKSYKDLDIYYIGYITIKKKNLYLRIDHARGYTEENNGNKYLIFDSVDEKKSIKKNIFKFGMELKKINKSNKW